MRLRREKFALVKTTHNRYQVVNTKILVDCTLETQKKFGYTHSFFFQQEDDQDGYGYEVFEDCRIISCNGESK